MIMILGITGAMVMVKIKMRCLKMRLNDIRWEENSLIMRDLEPKNFVKMRAQTLGLPLTITPGKGEGGIGGKIIGANLEKVL